MKRILREPLLHFLLIGAVLFAVFGWVNRDAPSDSSEIFVSRGQVQSLRAQFERVWQRPATQAELQNLVDGWVREEIYYREGLALGLDRDDPVVRRRVGQKVEFIMDSAIPVAPTTPELQAWLDAHAADYAVEPVYSLRQVYFDPARHGERLQADIATARRALERGAASAGDSTLLPPEVSGARASELTRTFGADFTSGLEALPTGSWQGPVRSTFGWHLVQISSRAGGGQAKLAEVRDAVERDLLRARTEQSNKEFYDRLRANYTVRVEG